MTALIGAAAWVIVSLFLAYSVLKLSIKNKNLKRQIDIACPHAWSLWEKEQKIKVWGDGPDYPTGFLHVQSRSCAICGLIEYNKQMIEP